MSKLQAYYIFAENTRIEIKEQDSSLSVIEVNRKIGEKWQNMTNEQKEYYICLQTNRERLNSIRNRQARLYDMAGLSGIAM